MKKFQPSSFKVSPVTAAIAIAVATSFGTPLAMAGSGFGTGATPTYYANSAAGPSTALVAGSPTLNPVTGLPKTINSGKALRKFVDDLPGIPGLTTFGANKLGQYIPLARAEKWVDLNGVTTADDYYEIAAVEYSEKMHSDLVKPTRLRGYVQLSTTANPGKKIALKYPNGTPILNAAGAQVFAHDQPHHLGPIIQSAKGTAVRIKFINYLPTGADGALFIPVDTTLTGAGLGPDGLTPYTENRVGMHLVGGQSPWISAGSPHQWVAPAGEVAAYAAGLGKGVSSQNVPDMAEPEAGATTLYFPNDMSARFTFVQDRTSGLTRLNAYAGLQAGYFVTDPQEAALVASGAIPADQIPLIIEDKTFVPGDIAQQDAKWTDPKWGKPGDLWFPHVYETNQAPLGTTANGSNPVGRWDFGPLFWPIFPAKDALPTGEAGAVSSVPEAFMDTPLINGTAYPKLTVDPKAYRFRILNASNDRYINLALYKADSLVKAPQLDLNGNPIVDAAGKPVVMTNTEVKMVPAVGDAAGNPVNWDATVVNADGSKGALKPLPQYPALPTNIVAEPSGPTRAWPTDARIGGAPDPAMSGPDFIAIGNDGGFLPHAVDIPAQPVTYETNRRSITVGNIYGYGMLLGPSERADAIVDFSAYAGQTLILYNDAPAPAPFNDVRNDYFTGGPDQVDAGGAYATKPGYGPNTRTMMQITVNAAPAVGVTAFSPAKLITDLPAAYGASQPAPIVPAVAYNAAFNTNDADVYAHVATGSMAQPNLAFVTGVNGGITLTGLSIVTSGGTATPGGIVVGNSIPGTGTGYDPLNPPTVVFNNMVNGVNCLTGGATASAIAVVNATTHQVTGFTNWIAGSGYTCAPVVTFDNPAGTSGVGAQAVVNSSNTVSYPVLTKAEQELFDNHGRYNSTGGIELPLTNGVVQTTVPLNYIDSATETLNDGEVQIWKLVDNGLWTNSIHFSMADVQLINRVGWDGTVKAPANNELGWKDTLRLNPLEDVVVAMRAKRSNVPFGLPKSTRLQDPSKPQGVGNAPAVPVPGTTYASGLGFTVAPGVMPLPAVTNITADYDNEFFWGSAILGHAENDLTRPVVFKPTVTLPDAPSHLADPSGNGTLTWTDPTPAGQLASAPGVTPVTVATIANPKNEVGFKILQATLDNLGNVGPLTPVLAAGKPVTVPANVTRWTNPAPSMGVAYAVVAYNAAGDSDPSNTFSETPPVAPTTFTALVNSYNSVTLSWSGGTSTNALQVWRSAPGLAATMIASLPGTATGYKDTTVTALMSYTYQIKAVSAVGTASSAQIDVTTPMIPVTAPTIVSAIPTTAGTSVTLRWTDNANNETAYWVDATAVDSSGAVTTNPRLVIARTAAQGLATGGAMNTVIASTPGSVYTFTVTAVDVTNPPTGQVNSTSTPPVSITVDLSAPIAPSVPSGLNATLTSATNVRLSWVDNASTENSYLVTTTNTTTGAVVTSTVNRSAAQSVATGGAVTANIPVVAGNIYSFTVAAQATRFGLTTASAAAGPTTMDVSAPVPPTGVTAVAGALAGQNAVTWVDASSSESGFTVQRRQLGALGVWGAWANAGTVAAGVQTFLDTGRTTGRSYQYQVRANGVVGNSAWVGPSATVIAP